MNQLSKMSYNYIKNVKDKENKILSYYKKINSIEQPKILAIPKRKKNTKKNLDNIKKLYENNELLISKEDENKKEDEKKLTKKRVVDMGD
jgi:hypothetical protein